jgi:CBS domain-containing protein
MRDLVCRERGARESIFGLLDFALHATAGFTLPSATADERDLLAALAQWDRTERSRLRLEADVFEPRALALGASGKEVVRVVRHLELLLPGGVSRKDLVYCRVESRSVDVDWCRCCPVVHGVERDRVRCAPDLAEHLGGAGSSRTACVAEALDVRQVQAARDVPTERIVRALADVPGAAAALVDDGQRVLGLFEDAEPRSSSTGQASVDLDRDGQTIFESAPLAEALARMAKTHRRHLAVVRDDGKVVGVLSETDALRWRDLGA